MKKNYCAVASLTALASCTSAWASADGCDDVLKYASRNYSYEQSSIGISVDTYENHCQGSSYKGDSSSSVGLGATLDQLPLKFSMKSGSAQERMQYFCKTFDADYKNNVDLYRQTSSVVQEAISAWNSCKTLASRGVNFKPQVGSTQVNVEVTRDTAYDTIVQGVHYNADAASCTVPNSNADSTTVAADKNTVKTLGTDSWTITCMRKPEKTNTSTYFPAFDIAVNTTRGNLLFPVAAENKLNMQDASDIQRRITELSEQLNQSSKSSIGAAEQLNKRIGNIQVTLLSSADGHLHLVSAPGCPAGFKDGGVFVNSRPGGPHGMGSYTRLCYSVQ